MLDMTFPDVSAHRQLQLKEQFLKLDTGKRGVIHRQEAFQAVMRILEAENGVSAHDMVRKMQTARQRESAMRISTEAETITALLFAEIDVNHDNKINFKEFVDFAKHLTKELSSCPEDCAPKDVITKPLTTAALRASADRRESSSDSWF